MMDKVTENFGHRVRLRVCGLLVCDNKLLLIKHQGLGELDEIWLPPGGGVEFGEHLSNALIREFEEETGLVVQVESFLFVSEHVVPPLHAVELFYRVKQTRGELVLGKDPELTTQIMTDIRWFDVAELKSMDQRALHERLRGMDTLEELLAPNV